MQALHEAPGQVVRVGDEHDVELLPGRLPNPTSAAAVVANRVVEVENGANNAGNTARIRVLDVDDDQDYVLAEVVTAGVSAAKKRRRRGGRGKAVPTAAEQAKQLRELAEEAAHQASARPPIGISTATEEEEAQDKALLAERRGEEQADAIIIARGEIRHGEEEGDHHKRRRRRRGRRGRGGRTGETPFQPADGAAPQRAVTADAEPPQPGPSLGAAVAGDGKHHRRRRRRRGRGGSPGAEGAEPLTGSLPQRPLPDRHIFRVGSDGSAAPTGETAPREPSRAIERVRAAAPAVEAPPPSLSAAAEEPRKTKPARRRRTVSAPAAAPAKLESAAIAALPAAEAKPKRTRKKAAEAAGETPAKTRKPAAKKTATARKKKAAGAAAKKKL